LLGYHCALITPCTLKLYGKYLNTFFHSKYMHKYFEFNATGSGQRYSLSQQVLNDIPIILPVLNVQEDIGDFFSLFDREIALDKAINHNLWRLDHSSEVELTRLVYLLNY
jgi:type I restriction enzyme S subunit